MKSDEKIVYEVRCINCNGEIPCIVPMGFPMESGNTWCPKCGVNYKYLILDGRLKLKRHSVPIGFIGEIERTFDPVKGTVDKDSERRPASVMEAYHQFSEQIESIPENDQLKAWAHIGPHLMGFSSSEILHTFDAGGGLKHCLVIFSTLHYNLIAESDLCWAWSMIGFDFQKVGISDLARHVFLKALTYANSPNAVAWFQIKNYFPKVDWSALNMEDKKSKVVQFLEQETTRIPSTPEELLTVLEAAARQQEQREEESKRLEEERKQRQQKQEESAWQKAEEERRARIQAERCARIQAERKSSGLCVMCGQPLRFLERYFLMVDRHSQCTEFKE